MTVVQLHVCKLYRLRNVRFSCDIGESIGLDKKVEQYRIQAMISVVTLLLKHLVESNNMDPQLADRLVKKINLIVSEIQQSSSKENKLEMEKVLRRLRRIHEVSLPLKIE